MTTYNITKKTLRLLKKFDKEAQNWGYISDQGSEDEAILSEHSYLITKKALFRRIEELEKILNKIDPTLERVPVMVE